jgi:N-acetylneuraminate lyase
MTKPFSIVAAAFTPLNADGSLALGTIVRQVERLVADGATGAFICGTTGEGAALTTRERKQVAEAWIAAAPKGFEIIVHVGHASVAEAAELAAHAAGAGASAIAAVAPYFLKPRSAADLVECLAPIAAARPTLPFFYYHIPMVTGITIPAADVMRVAMVRIPNFAGVKFTGDDLGDLGRVLDLAGERQRVFFGRDDMLLPAMALGVRHAVGMTFNFTAPIVRAMAQAHDTGDQAAAARQQKVIRDVLGASAPYGIINGLKALGQRVAVDCGPCRLPLATLTETEARSIEDASDIVRALGATRTQHLRAA